VQNTNAQMPLASSRTHELSGHARQLERGTDTCRICILVKSRLVKSRIYWDVLAVVAGIIAARLFASLSTARLHRAGCWLAGVHSASGGSVDACRAAGARIIDASCGQDWHDVALH
jgi:hypothetical protein